MLCMDCEAHLHLHYKCDTSKVGYTAFIMFKLEVELTQKMSSQLQSVLSSADLPHFAMV